MTSTLDCQPTQSEIALIALGFVSGSETVNLEAEISVASVQLEVVSRVTRVKL